MQIHKLESYVSIFLKQIVFLSKNYKLNLCMTI